MHFDTVEARELGADRGRDEPVPGLQNLTVGHRDRTRESLRVFAEVDGDIGRTPRHARHVRPHLSAGVADLHPHRRTGGLARGGPACEGLDRGARIEHDAAGTGERLGLNHHVAGDQQPGTTGAPPSIERDRALIGQLPFARHALFHRGLGDPVGQDLPGAQSQRGEQLTSVRPVRHTGLLSSPPRAHKYAPLTYGEMLAAST